MAFRGGRDGQVVRKRLKESGMEATVAVFRSIGYYFDDGGYTISNVPFSRLCVRSRKGVVPGKTFNACMTLIYFHIRSFLLFHVYYILFRF
jgi:hypothetical protein